MLKKQIILSSWQTASIFVHKWKDVKCFKCTLEILCLPLVSSVRIHYFNIIQILQVLDKKLLKSESDYNYIQLSMFIVSYIILMIKAAYDNILYINQ